MKTSNSFERGIKPEPGLTGLEGYIPFYIAALTVVALDQLSKLWIFRFSELAPGSYWPHGGIEIIPRFFYIANVGNTGAAWGILAGYGSALAVLALIALGAIYYYRNEFGLKSRSRQIPFGLLCGGIVGNLVDRIYLGYVIDFLDFHLPGYRWPAFNFADSGISVGITIYIIQILFFEKRTD